MKRKIFSKLLMVALVIAAVGSFVSCKDYDDDINNLQKQIDNAALKSSVEALQSTLETKIAAAQSAAQAAQTAADNAAKTAGAAVTKAQLDDAISAAKSAAATAANEYADKVAAAAQTAAAQKAYDDAKAYVDAEVAKVTAAIPSEAAIKAIADASAAALDEALATELKAWVNEQIAAIDVEGKVEAAVAKAIEKIETAGKNVAAIWSAVTSIEFAYSGYELPNTSLNFKYGTEIDNVFGDKTEVNAYAKADEKKTYVAGDSIKAENVYILRVSPVNADLKTSDLKLINSKGENLNDYVKIDVKPYTDLITRANETGLWKVTVTLKDNFKIEELQKAVHAVIRKDGTQTTAAVYAFAANTDAKAAADRYAVTSYDLYPETGKYVPVNELFVDVNGNDISTYYNRWNGGWIVAEDGTAERDTAHFETVWKTSTAAIPTPAAKGVWGAKANIQKDGTDYTGNALLAVKVGEPITINFAPAQYSQIDRFYVLLDLNNAVESDPSESNIWVKYDIDGLGKMMKSSEKLTITINDAEAEGDIIGFRVYATNYDGTLVDPDGKAFYVQVGDPEEIKAPVIAAQFLARVPDATAALPAVDWTDFNDVFDDTQISDPYLRNLNTGLTPVSLAADAFEKGDFATAQTAAGYTITFANADYNTQITSTAAHTRVTVHYWLLNANYGLAQKPQDIAWVLTSVDYPGIMVNNTTVQKATQLNVIDNDHHGKIVDKLALSLKKNMPTCPEFTWNESRGPVGGVLTIYPTPGTSAAATAWSANTFATAATFDLRQYVTLKNPASAAGYDFDVKYRNAANTADVMVVNSANFGAGAAVDMVPVPYEDETNLEFVFNKQYNASITYSYPGINTTYRSSNGTFNNIETAYSASPASAQAISKVKFVDRLDPSVQHYAWNSYNYYVGNATTATPVATAAQRVQKNSTQFFFVWGGVTTAKADAAIPAGTLCKFFNAVDYTGAAPGIVSNATMPKVIDAVNSTVANGGAGGDFFAFLNSKNDVSLDAGGFMLTRENLDNTAMSAWYANVNLGSAMGNRYLLKVTANGTEYFTGCIQTNGTLTDNGANSYLAPSATALAPATTLQGKLEVYATNVFGLNWAVSLAGNTWLGFKDVEDMTPIFSLPVTIYPNEASIVY